MKLLSLIALTAAFGLLSSCSALNSISPDKIQAGADVAKAILPFIQAEK